MQNLGMIKEIISSLWFARRHRKIWEQRIADVMRSSDNAYIHRHADAGKLISGAQVMHNGQKIIKGSYYGSGITKMLLANRGVHEPQEERVFQEVLKTLSPDAIMVELGAYWGFYSMWFLQQIPQGKTYLYEPNFNNLAFGKANFKLNGLVGDFNRAFTSNRVDLQSQPPIIDLAYIFKDKRLDQIDILHCDIQRYEYELLSGASELLQSGRIGYLFISTHSPAIHQQCLNIVNEANYEIIAQADLDETFSVDGLIVARHRNYAGIGPIEISKNTKAG